MTSTPNRGRMQIALVIVVQWSVAIVSSVWTQGHDRTACLFILLPLATGLCVWLSSGPSSMQTLARCGFISALNVTLWSLLQRTTAAAWFLGHIPFDYQLTTSITLAFLLLLSILWGIWLRRLRGRLRSFALACLPAVALVFGVVQIRFMLWTPTPANLVVLIDQLQQNMASHDERQQLADVLAICGREQDAERVAGRTAQKNHRQNPTLPAEFDNLPLQPWQTFFESVARKHQLVLIMEAHFVSGHRRFIEQTLPLFADAGFQHYAAEALAEPGPALKQRGYPIVSTGFYTSDPAFGNLLRRATDLGFNLHAYEAHGVDFQARERAQASRLSKILRRDPRAKILVHAGYGHIIKRTGNHKTMASFLREMTGIEPFCLWQIWHSPQESEARLLAGLVDDAPKILAPFPQNRFSDAQFSFPPDAIDAVVIHKPAGEHTRYDRGHRNRRLTIHWAGDRWPVLVGAYKRGEYQTAIPIDQALLVDGDRQCTLWTDDLNIVLRVHDAGGRVPSSESQLSVKFDSNYR